MTLEILDEAKQDLLDGFRFYEEREPGIGAYFLDSLSSDIDSLQLYAGIHTVHFGYHRLLSRRFPFAIYYAIAGDVVQVWAVMDCRRDPQTIEDRLVSGRRTLRQVQQSR